MSDEQIQVENEEPQVPEWVPEKFRTNPEAFGKSYSELEAKLTQTTQDLRAQQEQFEQYLAQQEQQSQQQVAMPEAQDQLYQAYEQDPLSVMAWLAEQAAGRAVQQNGQQSKGFEEAQYALVADAAERQLEARYSDWQEYAPKVAERIQARSALYPDELFRTPQGTAQVLEEVYKTVKADDVLSGAVTLQQQTEADQRAMKQGAQTLSGAAGRPDTPNDDEEFFARLQAAHNTSYSAFRGSA